MAGSIGRMDSAHPSAIRLKIVNQSAGRRTVKISPWGESVSLRTGDGVTISQTMVNDSYFEIDVWDMGVFVHAWPTAGADVVTADRTIALDSKSVAPQSDAGRARGWPEDSRNIVDRYIDATIAGFFVTDSRSGATAMKAITEHSEIRLSASGMTWMTAISHQDAPSLEVHDHHLVVVASQVWPREEPAGTK